MWEYLVYSTSAILVTLVTGTIILFYTNPKHVIYWALRLNARRCGMIVNFVGDEHFVYCYGERGRKVKNKSTVLCVHGFTASKDMWLPLFQKLPSDIHLIAIDLPGHGSSTIPKQGDELSMKFLVDHVYKFVKLMKLDDDPFHLTGTSLGGAVVANFAAEHPELIDRLTLICPAMRTPEHSPFMKTAEEAGLKGYDNIEITDCPLIPLTSHDAQRMLNSCIYHKTTINKQILIALVDLRKPKNNYFFDLFKALAKEEATYAIERRAHDIKAPTQIMWGINDEIIDVSGATVLEKLLPDCKQVDIIERCGHCLHLDRPGALMKSLLTFRGEYPTGKL